MKTISYYISMVVILAATIFTGGTDDDVKSLSPRAGELSIYDFAPNTADPHEGILHKIHLLF